MRAADPDRPVRAQPLIFGQPVVDEAAIAEVVDSLRRGWLGAGPKVARFEELIADYVGARHATAVSSCTAGLHLVLVVAGIGPGDEVITSPLTFPATANAIVHAGGTPVFADVDPATQNIDPVAIAAAVTERTRAVVPVHFAGRPCDIDAVHVVARAHDLLVVEDAAHAIGAVYRGRRVGSISHATVFSFYATKNLTTGEGGMVTTDDEELAAKVGIYRQHGMSTDAWDRLARATNEPATALVAGFKYNMTDLHAALGLHGVARIDEWQERRQAIWCTYDAAFAELPVAVPSPAEPDTVHARHLYTLLLDLEALGTDRAAIRQALWREGIGTGVHYPVVHLQPYYVERYGYGRGTFPNAELIGERTLSLPLSPFLTDDDVTDVTTAVRRVLGRARRA